MFPDSSERKPAIPGAARPFTDMPRLIRSQRTVNNTTTGKMSLSSVLQKGKAFLTPRTSTDSISKTPAFIFPRVDPAIDGEDCDHDCETCEIQYPKGFKIDEDEKLYGHVNGFATHMLVATGKTDWVRDVSDEKGSVMEAVRDCKVEPSNGVCIYAPATFLARNIYLTGTMWNRNSCSPPPTYPSLPPTPTSPRHPPTVPQPSSSSPPSPSSTTSPPPQSPNS